MFLKILVILSSCFIAYILSSFNFAIFISKKFYHKNIKKLGSKNAGMTNVLRNFGTVPAIITLVGDIFKGFLSILICHILCHKVLNPEIFMCFKYIVLIFALLGHIFPIFYNFKGGKGISVVTGAILFINVKIFLILLTIFILVFKFSKIVSLSSLSSTFAFPIATFLTNYFNNKTTHSTALIITSITTIASIIVIFAHKENIIRLLKKKEPKIKK